MIRCESDTARSALKRKKRSIVKRDWNLKGFGRRVLFGAARGTVSTTSIAFGVWKKIPGNLVHQSSAERFDCSHLLDGLPGTHIQQQHGLALIRQTSEWPP